MFYLFWLWRPVSENGDSLKGNSFTKYDHVILHKCFSWFWGAQVGGNYILERKKKVGNEIVIKKKVGWL